VGTWGPEPWDNDMAADWFGDLFDSMPIVDKVMEGLKEKVVDIQVAALWTCVQLCRVYIWDIDRLTETLQLAVETADSILAGRGGYLEDWGEDEPLHRSRLQAMRDELASRLINLQP